MNLYKYILLVGIFTLSTLAASSQGIRVEYFGVSGVASRYGSLVFYGFGYEQNVGDKISLGLTYRKGYDITDGETVDPEYVSYMKGTDEVKIDLSQTGTWKEFSYSSKYHFTDNSDGGFYIANSLSLFSAKTIINITSINVNGNSDISNYDGIGRTTYEKSTTLLPMTFDLGYRSEFDGWYQDYYFGINLLPFGNNKTVTPSQLSDHGITSKFNSLSFRFGMCFGIAW